MKRNLRIPKKFVKYFWDVDFEKLDFKKHKNFILDRLLNYGTFNTFSWIFSNFSMDDVKNLLKNNGKHSLSRNSYLFWVKIAKEKKLWKKN